jgi:hypothetical protein
MDHQSGQQPASSGRAGSSPRPRPSSVARQKKLRKSTLPARRRRHRVRPVKLAQTCEAFFVGRSHPGGGRHSQEFPARTPVASSRQVEFMPSISQSDNLQTASIPTSRPFPGQPPAVGPAPDLGFTGAGAPPRGTRLAGRPATRGCAHAGIPVHRRRPDQPRPVDS